MSSSCGDGSSEGRDCRDVQIQIGHRVLKTGITHQDDDSVWILLGHRSIHLSHSRLHELSILQLAWRIVKQYSFSNYSHYCLIRCRRQP